MNKNFLLLSSLLLVLPDASTTWATTQPNNDATNQTNDATNQTNDAPNQTNVAPNQTNVAPNQTNVAPNQTNDATNQTNDAANQANELAKLRTLDNQTRLNIDTCTQGMLAIYNELHQFQTIWATLGYNVLNWTAKNKSDTYGVTEPNNPTIDCLTNTKVGSLKAKDHSLAWGIESNVPSRKFKHHFYPNAINAINNTNAAWIKYVNTQSKLAEYYNKLNACIQQMETIQAFAQQHPDRVKVLQNPDVKASPLFHDSITPPIDVNNYNTLYTVLYNNQSMGTIACNLQTVTNPIYPALDTDLSEVAMGQNAKKIGGLITSWKQNIANVMLWQKATLDFSGLVKGLNEIMELAKKTTVDNLRLLFLVPEFVTYFKKLSTCIGIALNNITVNKTIVDKNYQPFSRALGTSYRHTP